MSGPQVSSTAWASLVELLRDRAVAQPDAALFAFLADGGDGVAATFTRGELDRRARALAVQLRDLGKEGGRALLLYPPGLEFLAAFFGCLYAGIVAVPAYPPRLNRPMTRLRSIVADAQPCAILTSAAQAKDVERWDAGVPEIRGVDRLITDLETADLAGLAERWEDPGAGPDSLAFLQYTSGSTAAPKGVMVTHGNLLENSSRIQTAFGTTSATRGVIWLPLFHDMGLIGGVIQTIYFGGSTTLFSPVSFLQRPALWLETISRTQAMVSGGPNFAFDLCARKVRAEDCLDLDLSHWEVAVCGAERVRADTIDRFVEKFSACGFRREAFFPCYGLAEATLMVSGGPRQTPPTIVSVQSDALERNLVVEAARGESGVRSFVGCGRNLPGQEIVIANPETRLPCDGGEVGEIWVRGPSVAVGYYGRPDATEATFGAHLATGEGPYLRTGDLGFLRDGQLFVTCRLKDVIIIRGRNYYPEDIEETVNGADAAFRPGSCAAFSIDVEDREQLVVVQEIEPRLREFAAEESLRTVRRVIATEHELEVFVIVLAKAGEIAKTSSGKTQRSACRDRYLSGELQVITHWQANAETAVDGPAEATTAPDPRQVSEEESEEWLIQRIATRTGLPPAQIHVTTPFLEFGLGSVDAVAIAAELESWLGRRMSPTVVYNYPCIAALAQWLSHPPPNEESFEEVETIRWMLADTPPERLLDDVRNMTDGDIQAFLMQEMARQ